VLVDLGLVDLLLVVVWLLLVLFLQLEELKQRIVYTLFIHLLLLGF
jgi:hypothetical protein